MNFIKQYLTILESSKDVMETCEKNGKKDAADYNLTKNTYRLAFQGLMQAGYPYTKDGKTVILVIEDEKYLLQSEPYETKETSFYAAPEVYRREQESSEETEETEEPENEFAVEENDVEMVEDSTEELAKTENEPEENESIEVVDEETEEEIESSGYVDKSESDREPEAENLEEIPEVVVEEEDNEPGASDEPEFEEEPNGFDYDMEINMGEMFGSDEEKEDYEPENLDIGQEEMEGKVSEKETEGESESKEDSTQEQKVNPPYHEEQKENKPATIEKSVEDVTVQMTRNTDMPADMFKSDFAFAYDALRIINESTGEIYDMRVVVYPFVLDEEKPAIIACVNTPELQEVLLCDEKGIINCSTDMCPFTITGCFENGKFKAEYSVSHASEEKGYAISVEKRRTFGDKGHILLCDDGVMIHIMPISFKNNGRGFADFIYYIQSDEGAKFGSSVDGPVCFVFQGDKMEIIGKWNQEKNDKNNTMENRLYCQVRER